MQFISITTLVALASIVSALPLQARSEGDLSDSLESTVGSIVGTGSADQAGNGNDASAYGNGNDNTGATASASNFLNGASATDNGVGDGNDGNSFIGRKRSAKPQGSDILGSILGTGSNDAAGNDNTATGTSNGNGNTGASAGADDFLNDSSATDNGVGDGNDGNSFISLKRSAEPQGSNVLGSILGTGSGDSAGDANDAAAKDNGNANEGATASADDFLNGSSAEGNGVGNDNDGNSFISLKKRVAALESALLQKRSLCESSSAIGSLDSTGNANQAGNADSGSAMSNGNSNTGATATASNFLNGASASDNGVLNDNDDNTLIDLTLPSSVTII